MGQATCSTGPAGPQLMPAVLLEEIRQQQRARINALEESLKAIATMSTPSAVTAMDIANNALALPDPAAKKTTVP